MKVNLDEPPRLPVLGAAGLPDRLWAGPRGLADDAGGYAATYARAYIHAGIWPIVVTDALYGDGPVGNRRVHVAIRSTRLSAASRVWDGSDDRNDQASSNRG